MTSLKRSRYRSACMQISKKSECPCNIIPAATNAPRTDVAALVTHPLPPLIEASEVPNHAVRWWESHVWWRGLKQNCEARMARAIFLAVAISHDVKSRTSPPPHMSLPPPHRHYRTSTTASISTEASPGNDTMPIAARACLPLSPKTSTKRSEAPFMTLG